jgi:hypothetical protein
MILAVAFGGNICYNTIIPSTAFIFSGGSPMNPRSFFLSALIAGAVIGVLGNLPVLNLINCIFCIWVWVGGIVSVYLYQRFQHGGPGLSGAQGAGLGAVAGIIGALVGVVVYALTSFISAPIFESLLSAFQVQGDLPFQSSGPWGMVVSAFFFLTVDAILYPIFGAIGGLIAASVFWKQAKAEV